MKKYTLALMASLFLAVTSFAKPIEPTYYTCQADEVQVSYSTSSFIGRPIFNLSIKNGASVNLMGKDITVQPTAIGSLVSVVSEIVPDAFTKTETLVVPTIHLKSFEDAQKFDTVLVRNTYLSSIGGPSFLTGVISHSEYIPLSCTAQYVLF